MPPQGSTDEEKEQNARYALSVARKFGAVVFITYEDIVEVKPKMIMLLLAACMAFDKGFRDASDQSVADGAAAAAGGGGGGEIDSSTHVAGALSCVVGNFLISLSLNLQRRAHRDNTEGVHYTKFKAWWVAILCMFVGEIGNFLAYGMAPASLVSPLGAFTVCTDRKSVV